MIFISILSTQHENIIIFCIARTDVFLPYNIIGDDRGRPVHRCETYKYQWFVKFSIFDETKT